MKNILILSLLLSLASIAVPLRAEQQICEAGAGVFAPMRKEREKTDFIKIERFEKSKDDVYIRRDCMAGDILYLRRFETNNTPPPEFLSACDHKTIKVYNGSESYASGASCIYRGADNLLKLRGADEEK